jgi:hypothetical protein
VPDPLPAPERPQLTSVPAPPPLPRPVEPERSFESTKVVSFAAHDTRPKEWNVWELERVVRSSSVDAFREEELNYLLMYLREFANADGALPVDFDSLVRDSFAELLAAPAR